MSFAKLTLHITLTETHTHTHTHSTRESPNWSSGTSSSSVCTYIRKNPNLIHHHATPSCQLPSRRTSQFLVSQQFLSAKYDAHAIETKKVVRWFLPSSSSDTLSSTHTPPYTWITTPALLLPPFLDPFFIFHCENYPNTLPNSTLIILFSKMLKFSKNYFFQIKKYCEGE
jgi:hypothetical protein